MTCLVDRITLAATRTGCRCRRSPQTLPQRPGDSITAPSRLTRPLASGSPPYPTESTRGSRSASPHTSRHASRALSSPSAELVSVGQPRRDPASENDQVESSRGLIDWDVIGQKRRSRARYSQEKCLTSSVARISRSVSPVFFQCGTTGFHSVWVQAGAVTSPTCIVDVRFNRSPTHRSDSKHLLLSAAC